MTTLKKIIGLVLVVAIFASMAVTLSSCKGGNKDTGKDSGKTPDNTTPHTHTFYNPWMYDAENHWHAPSCGHTEEKGEFGAHKDKNYDDLCDVCGYNFNSNMNVNTTTTYVVYVKDEAGQPVANVKVMLVSPDSYTAYKITDSRGRVTFTIGEGEWKAALAEAVPSYSNTVEELYVFDESGQITITLK